MPSQNKYLNKYLNNYLKEKGKGREGKRKIFLESKFEEKSGVRYNIISVKAGNTFDVFDFFSGGPSSTSTVCPADSLGGSSCERSGASP